MERHADSGSEDLHQGWNMRIQTEAAHMRSWSFKRPNILHGIVLSGNSNLALLINMEAFHKWPNCSIFLLLVKKKWVFFFIISLLGLEKLLSSKWALTAFLEVLGLNPNIYMVTVTTICNSSSRGSEVLLWQPVYQTSRWCIHTHNRKYIFKDHYASIFGSKMFDIRLFDSGFSLPFLFLNFYVHLRWPCTR